jgi:glycosyltransferase involved in cell wall biosynthesis
MHFFIVPNLDGPITGGTLFNRSLIAAMRELRCACRVMGIEAAPLAMAKAGPGDWFWVDSLFMEIVPSLAMTSRVGAGLGLVLHYLPSLLGGESARPSDKELSALQAAQAIVVPSAFLRGKVEDIIGPKARILLVEPGRSAQGVASLPAPPARMVMVANLLPGKGIVPFLRALSKRMGPEDQASLSIIGSTKMDPMYASRCEAMAQLPSLRCRVVLEGALSPTQTLERMRAANLFVSASFMESYGMALAEARTLGLPIVAIPGGHVAAQIDRDGGGEACDTPVTLADACLALARDPAEHSRRMALARMRALPPRSWTTAARAFVLQAWRLGGGTQAPSSGDFFSHAS